MESGAPWGVLAPTRAPASLRAADMHTAVVSTPALYLEQLAESWARDAADGSLVLNGSRGTRKSLFNTIAAVRRDLSVLHDLAHGELPANQTSITVAATMPASDFSKSINFKTLTTLANSTIFTGFGYIDNCVAVGSGGVSTSAWNSFISLSGIDWSVKTSWPTEPCAAQQTSLAELHAAAEYRMPLSGGTRLTAFAQMHEILHSAAKTPLTWYFGILANEVYARLLISALRQLLDLAQYLMVKMRAHVSRACGSAIAVISVFMSHRHRREPADGRLLPNHVNVNPWRVAVGL